MDKKKWNKYLINKINKLKNKEKIISLYQKNKKKILNVNKMKVLNTKNNKNHFIHNLNFVVYN